MLAPFLAAVLNLAAGSAQAALTINSIVPPDRIGRGQTFTMPVNYQRQSGSGAETVVVTTPAQLVMVTPLPAGCTLSGSAGSAQTLTCTAVDPGATIGSSGTFTVQARGYALGGGNVSASDAGPPASSAQHSFTVVAGGDFSISQSRAPTGILINGQDITFTVTPARTGDTVPPLAVITLTDQLPGTTSEFTLSSISAPGYTCDSASAANASRTLTCSITGAEPGTITLVGRTTLSGTGGLANTASIATDGINYVDFDASNDSALLAFSVDPGADARPQGSFAASAVASTAQNLTIQFTNDGPQSVSGGQVRASIPSGFTIGALPSGCANGGAGTVNGVAGTLLVCTSGTVTSGSSQSFVLPLTTPAVAASGNFGVEIITGAGNSLPGGLTDYNPGNNRTLVPYVVLPPYADLFVGKTKTAGPLEIGALITSVIDIGNNGLSPAVYSARTGTTPLRVTDTMSNDEEFVSGSSGWTCTDGGANSAGAGQRRVTCARDNAGTLAVGGTLNLTLTTRVSTTIAGPVALSNTACVGATVLSQLGLGAASGPQPADSVPANDCDSRSTVGTPVTSGQAQASVVKSSSRDGTTWSDPVGSPVTVTRTDNSMYWRMRITTPGVAANPAQKTIPTLAMSDPLKAILSVGSPASDVPGWTTPAAQVSTSVSTGSAGGGCPATVAAGSTALDCSFSNVAPGTTIDVTVRVDRPFEAGTFINTATLSSPDAILSATPGGQLHDDAAVIVEGRSDPAVMSKIVTPQNSATAPRIGQVVSYTIVVRNLGPNLINGPLTVTDTLDPARFVLLGASAIGGSGSPAMNCSTVPSTGSVTCATAAGTSVPRHDFYTVTVQARILKPGGSLGTGIVSSFTNTARVALDSALNCEFKQGSSVACNDAASTSNNSGSVLVDIKVPEVDLALGKEHVLPPGQSTFAFGDLLRYRFRALNNGPSRAEGVVVSDRLSAPPGYTLTLAGITAVNSVAAASSYQLDTDKTLSTLNCTQASPGADVVCTLASGAADFLDPGREVNFDLEFTLSGPAVIVSVGDIGRICSDETAGYESQGACSFTPSVAGNNLSSVNDLVLPKTDLSITKSRVTASPVSLNQPVEYALVLSNLGGDSTTQLRVTDVLPPNFEWLSSGAYAPAATVGGFAGLTVSAVNCTATPASITVPGQQQTVSCVIDGNFPGSAAASNRTTLRLFARAKADFFTGPYLNDRANTATISPGQDGTGQPLSLDPFPRNNQSGAITQVQVASLAGTVFEDRNRSAGNAGTPQAAATEPRIAGVAIRLTGTDAFGYPVDRVTSTDASGNYSFPDLPPAGSSGYTLTQTQPAGFRNAPDAPPVSGAAAPTAGGTYAPGGANGDSSYSAIPLAAGVTGTQYNFPELRSASLSGTVYIDADASGTRNAPDSGISGATVRLLNASTGALIATTTTAANGSYAFTNLDPLIVYTLEEPLPSSPAGLRNAAVNPGLVGGAACASGCTAQSSGTATGTDRIAAIDLGSFADGTQFDFGEAQTAVIAGMVYVDLDRNGGYDGAVDQALPGVTVRLVQGANCSSGTTLDTQVTIADGSFQFSDVAVGASYLICETQPAGYGQGTVTPASGATLSATDAIAVPGLTLAGSSGHRFGELRASIAGTVYKDSGAGIAANFNNGVKDSGEAGIANVPVVLSGRDVTGASVNATVITDANGNFLFDGLLAANGAGYTLTEGVIPPSEGTFLDGKETVGSAGGSAAVNDVISAVALAAGQQATGYLFGELPVADISGVVYLDRNRSNTWDGSSVDAPIRGVTLRLVQGSDCSSGSVLQTLASANDGSYRFANVAVGANYLICETQPTGYANGTQNLGAAASSPADNVILVTNLPAAGSTGNHFGERLGGLSGYVYADHSPATPAQTDNGRRDSGETGIKDVPVTLSGRDITGASVNLTVTTDASGNFSFTELLQSDATGYSLSEGAIPSASGVFNDGRDTAGTAGGTAGNDVISAIVLGAGVLGTDYAFGELPIAPITGTVYIDRNRNGLLESVPTDGRLSGVVIKLVTGTDCSRAALATTSTDANGNYGFSGISAGLTYTLCESQPAGYADGGVIAGDAASSALANTITITNLPAAGSAGNHFGEWVGSLSGAVYADFTAATPANTNNGQRDPGEAGIAGVSVTLSGLDITGAAVNRSATTAADGSFSFADLMQSDSAGYTLAEGAIPAVAGSFNDGRETAGTAGGSIAVNDRIGAIVLGAGVQANGYLFGELPSVNVSGTVFIDRNRDNVMDPVPTDGRIAGVVLRLVQGSDCASGSTLQSTSTDANGNYSFGGVSVGANYLLCETQPTGYGNGVQTPGTAGVDGGANLIRLTNLPASGSVGNLFGERVATLAGSVYLDTNNDGNRQSGETGLPGVTVTLSGTDAVGTAVSRSTVTDASGNYRFDDLLAAGAAGYTLTEQRAQPVVTGITTLNGRTSAGTIGGAGVGTATAVITLPSAISAITLAAGADGIDYRFGELLPVSISGLVFMDLNDNGLQNLPADAGLAGVVLAITGTDDTGAAVTRSVTTAADGSYALADLRPGSYTVTEPTQPAGTSNGKTLPGSAGGTATGVLVLPSQISGIVLASSGATSTGNNFAEIPNTSVLDGRVWLDANNNGVFDSGETGIAGVRIELTGTDTASRPVARNTLTDSNGRYSFGELAPGTYALTEPVQPAGTVNGQTRPGSAGGTATVVATTPSALTGIVLAVGATASANDFAEVPAAQIAGRVWTDNNNNGVIDTGEGGLGGVTLVLSGTDDLARPVSQTMVTAADGSYAFTGLRPGTYTVTEPTQPAGSVNGITVAGSSGGSATAATATPSAIAGIVLAPGAQSLGNNFGELANSPDLRVVKTLDQARLTVGFPGSYTLAVRNLGEIASSGTYTVSDRLPTGLTLAATPTGSGWTCVGAAGASSFSCTSTRVITAGAVSPDTIAATVRVAAAAAAASPVNNVVLVEGGGEIDARAPSATEREAFNGNPGSLPVCVSPAQHNACRTPTPVQLAASVSGTTWYDVGSSPHVLDGGDTRLAGWLVEVIDTGSGLVVGTATTAADGSYRVTDLMPGVSLGVRFRDPASGIVFGYPVNGETAAGSSGVGCDTEAAANGRASSCVGSGSTPALTVVLAPGQNLPQQSLPVDPSGVVYDSGLRTPVPGSIVSLEPVGSCSGWNPATAIVGATLGGYTINGGRISMTVGANGFYQFLIGPSAPSRCEFRLVVTPPSGSGYTFTSAAIPPATGALAPSGGAGSSYAVQPQAGPPTAEPGPGTLYYLDLFGGSAAANIVHNHLPLDPALPGSISISKTGDRAMAEVGDSVRYTITVAVSTGALPRQTTVVDRLPAGFTYIPGTAMVGSTAIADPQGGFGPVLAFNLGPMPASRQLVLRYRVRVGVGAMQGDGVNRARGHACSVPAGCVDASFAPRAGSVATNEASHRVRVSGGVFTTDACVMGKVFVDCNHNHVQDAEELGIPGVRLVMQDGTTLISDSEGKYSVCGVPPQSAVLKVDPITLPRGARLTTSSNRNLGDAGSLWLDLKNGELHRADFIEGSCSNTVLEQVKARRAQGEVRAPENERKGRPALRFDSKAHERTPLTSPQQGTDGANQRLPKPRPPEPPPSGAEQDETHVPTTELPMNKPAPRGRDSGVAADAPAATDAGGRDGTR